MKQFFDNRGPKHYNQKGNTAPHNQQGFSPNASLPNSMPMQPQMGLVNPQIPVPFNNSNTLLSNGQPMPNMPPLIPQQPGLLSGPNDMAILQLQNQVNKLNTLKMLMDQVNQLQGELFGPGFSNMPQQFNHNMGLLQNPVQNMMNAVRPMQMPITSQAGSFNVPSSSQQVVGAQSPNFFVNQPFGVQQQVNPNQQNFLMPTTGANGSNPLPVANQQMQGNLSAPHQSQNFVMPTTAANVSNPLTLANQQVQGNLPAPQQNQNSVMPTVGANGSNPMPFANQQVQGNLSAPQRNQNFVMPTVGANGSNPQPVAYQQVQGNLPAPQQNQNSVMPTVGANGSNPQPFANQQVQWNSFASLKSQNFSTPTVGANGSKALPVASQPVEGNSPASQQSENFGMPIMATNGPRTMPIASQQAQGNPSASQQSKSWQPAAYDRWQGNPGKNGQSSTPNAKWGNFSGKNSKKNAKREKSQSRYQKSELRCMDNGKRKLGFSDGYSGKGLGIEREAKFGRSDPTNESMERKSSRTFIYTEEDIKWRESRRKHFPTKTNIEKKQTEKLINSEVVDKEANFRRKQLKEVLARQAELGVEVAEIPPEYLLESEKLGVEVAKIPPHQMLDEKQERGRKDNRRSFRKKGKFRNKNDRRGTHNSKGRPEKQLGLINKDRKPTLLEKLLSADIRRDKHRLLQVFRFMVANSFFKDWPDKPLKFPSLVVKEDGYEVELAEETSSLVGEEVSEARNNKIPENFGDRNGENEHAAQVETGIGNVGGKCDIIVEVDRIEEGEIVD